MAHPAVWSEVTIWQAVSDMHLWLLAGWLAFSLLVAVVVGGGRQ